MLANIAYSDGDLIAHCKFWFMASSLIPRSEQAALWPVTGRIITLAAGELCFSGLWHSGAGTPTAIEAVELSCKEWEF